MKLQNIETPLRHFLYKVNFIKELHLRQAGPDSVEISWHNVMLGTFLVTLSIRDE